LRQRVSLTVRPLRELGEGSGLFMVIFRELGPSAASSDAGDGGRPANPSETITQQLESELRSTKEHLQAAVEELETSNEELTSSNEELLSTNEELQSSNEELQTSKEEMQSVNEELETINAELAKKVEQLDGAHSDLQNLFESTQIASIFLDKDLHIKKFTPAAMDVFRLIETDVGRSIADITPRFAEPDLFEAIRMVLRTLSKQERQVQLVDGSATYMARILPYRGVDNVIYGVVLTFVDITALVMAQSRQSELAAIVESSLDAIVARSLDGIVTIWNASAARMFGYSPWEAVGRPVSLIVPPEKLAEYERVRQRVENGEIAEPFESVSLTREGRRIPVSITVSSIRDTRGNITGASASFRSLAETQKAKEELMTEVRNRDQFLAMLGHELRGPLSPLRMCLEVLRSPGAKDKHAEKAKLMMERQLAHLTALVDQLLDASRISKGKIALDMKLVDLVQLARVVAEDHRDFIESQGLGLSVDIPSGSLWVHGDPVRLTQAIGNLLRNAGKFTEVGAVEVRLVAEKRGSLAVITVRDTGIGMDERMLTELFKPFSQADQSLDRSKGGLGLGLSLARALVEAHRGTIEAHSDGVGRGSLFTVRLPTIQGVRTEPGSPVSQEAKPETTGDGSVNHSRRVLVIEDNADAGESLGHVLGLMGHEAVVAMSGKAALEVARNFKPEVVLCDIGLPGDMNGYAVAKAFRTDAAFQGIYLVALTGYGREEDEHRAREAGFDLHLRKPADLGVLRRALVALDGRDQT
jgi:two-component system CheB/CheR fusion protein